MSILNMGPDGLLLVIALAISVLVAALSWRRVRFPVTALTTALVAIAAGLWLASLPNVNHQVLVGLFVIVPTALLLGVSRVSWIARHAWVLVPAGPVMFIGCYMGICEFCVKSGLIS